MHGNRELCVLLENGYGDAVADGIRNLVKTLDDNEALAAEFDPVADSYAADPDGPISEPLAKIKEIGEKYGINEYSLDLLFIMNGLPRMHERFAEKGLPDGVFYETMDDLRCKVLECIECKGVTGIFVPWWYDRFFRATCFGFGRFEYELATYGRETEFRLSCGITVRKGDRFVNIHVPSRGIPLTDEVRLASYRAAYRYFSRFFGGGPVVFGCESWLLFDRHREFLPEGMNILKFMSDFEPVACRTSESFGDIWRIFGRYASLPFDRLPRDTSLRSAYADWLCSGRKTGVGFGLFAFDGEKIL